MSKPDQTDQKKRRNGTAWRAALQDNDGFYGTNKDPDLRTINIEPQAKADQPLVLFDGVCNLCQRSVQFVIRHDRQAVFRFASLQSPVARRLLDELDYRERELHSVLYLENGQISSKSRAILKIAKQLDGGWTALFYLAFWIPRSVADRVYDFVGKRRYRWFGKKSACWLPNDALRRRFIDH